MLPPIEAAKRRRRANPVREFYRLAEWTQRKLEADLRPVGGDSMLIVLDDIQTSTVRSWLNSERTAKFLLSFIRRDPAMLLEPRGRTLRLGLVDLLEAANHGMTAGRVPGLIPDGKSAKQVSKFAQKALLTLTKRQAGGKLAINRLTYQNILLRCRCYIKWLQAEYVVSELWETHRKGWGRIFKSETDFAFILKDKNPLHAGARLAHRITGHHTDIFLRALREMRPQHEAQLKRDRTDPLVASILRISDVSHEQSNREWETVFTELDTCPQRSS